jgi:hypothetical protein
MGDSGINRSETYRLQQNDAWQAIFSYSRIEHYPNVAAFFLTDNNLLYRVSRLMRQARHPHQFSSQFCAFAFKGQKRDFSTPALSVPPAVNLR